MNDQPAFPAMHYDLAPNEHGMTLRDYFAAKAMDQIEFHFETYANGTRISEIQANFCYAIADAMLKARGEQHENT